MKYRVTFIPKDTWRKHYVLRGYDKSNVRQNALDYFRNYNPDTWHEYEIISMEYESDEV